MKKVIKQKIEEFVDYLTDNRISYTVWIRDDEEVNELSYSMNRPLPRQSMVQEYEMEEK